ncbi:MAG TPA: NERD domain-containing protein [Prolixibacteraceae bacterium]|jgi:hypothetical protein
MAQIYGIAKTWGEINTRLKNANFSVRHPREIETLLDETKMECEQQTLVARQKIEAEIDALEQAYEDEKKQVELQLSQINEKYRGEIEQSEGIVDLFQHNPGVFGFLRNYARVRRESQKLTRLRTEQGEQNKALKQALEDQKLELDTKKSLKGELVEQECAGIISKVDILKNVVGSPEFSRAGAEIELEESLQGLPENIILFNNISLQSEDGLVMDRKKFFHAHVDHLVLTPAGIFLIGIKIWHKHLTINTNEHALIDQLIQTTQFCNQLFRPDFPALIIRSILAYKGHQPENQSSTTVKVLPISEVSGYINWFNDEMLSNQEYTNLSTRIKEVAKTSGGEL